MLSQSAPRARRVVCEKWKRSSWFWGLSETFSYDISEFESLPEKKKENRCWCFEHKSAPQSWQWFCENRISLIKHDQKMTSRIPFDSMSFQEILRPPVGNAQVQPKLFLWLKSTLNIIYKPDMCWSIWIMTYFHMIWSKSQNNANNFSLLNIELSCYMWNLFCLRLLSLTYMFMLRGEWIAKNGIKGTRERTGNYWFVF